MIPNDYGAPIDVVASSPDAPDAVTVIDEGFQTVIRIGDPDETVTGQHRYTVAYTLPEAQLSRGFLAVDAIAGDEFDTDLAEVVVTGFDLDEQRCFAAATAAPISANWSSATACTAPRSNRSRRSPVSPSRA